MEVSYRTNKLEKQCSKKGECERKFGKMAEKVMQRLSELRGAQNLGLFESGTLRKMTGFHPLKGKRKGQYAVTTIHPFRLIFIPVGNYTKLEDVKNIMILEIEDYH